MYLPGAKALKMAHQVLLPTIIFLKLEVSKSGAQVSKSVHPIAKMCTPSAGCVFNFKH